MGLLDTILGNDKMKDAALGFLKKTMKEQGMAYVVVALNEQDQFDFQMFTRENQPVVFVQAQLGEIQRIMNDQLAELETLREQVTEYAKTIDPLVQDNERLVAMCKEQEQELLRLKIEIGVSDRVIKDFSQRISELQDRCGLDPIVNQQTPENGTEYSDPATDQ